MKQRILALLLAAGLCLGLIAAAPALAFSDVSGEELSEAVEVLSGLGIVSGYSDRSYHPDDALTRAQFCKLAVLTEGHGDQARGSAYRTRFSDVPPPISIWPVRRGWSPAMATAALARTTR